MKTGSFVNRPAFLGCFGLLFVCLSAAHVRAAVATIMNTSDSGANSLRQVISLVNSVPGPDTLVFDASLDGLTITLTTGEITITDGLTLDASSLPNGIQIDAGDASRIFSITLGKTVTMNNLTLRNGRAAVGNGGGISNSGTLYLNSCAFIDCSTPNYGGAIHNSSGQLTLSDCRFEGGTAKAAGGIFSAGGTLTALDSVFRQNRVTLPPTETGFDGGAVLIQSSEAVFDGCEFVENSSATQAGLGGGAIMVFSSLSSLQLLNSTFRDNSSGAFFGGAVHYYSLNQLTVDNCVFEGNTARAGGGLASRFGPVSISDSTFQNNDASNQGGGLAFDSVDEVIILSSSIWGNRAYDGGGILVARSPFWAVNSTFASNQAVRGGGLFSFKTSQSQLHFSHCTVSENRAQVGGGVFIDSQADAGPALLQFDNSILAGNEGGDLEQGNLYQPTFTMTGTNNLVGVGKGVSLVSPAVNQLGILDPGLAPLGDYGGPTHSMPPWAGSPAVNAATPSGLTTDQRGAPRVLGGVPDIGSVEAATYQVLNASDAGSGSLRATIANALDGSTIRFAPGLSGQILSLTTGQLPINKKLAIGTFGLDQPVTIDAQANSRIFEVTPGSSLSLEQIRLTGGAVNAPAYPANTGGGIFVGAGALVMKECTLSGCSTFGIGSQGGGAVFGSNSFIRISQCAFTNNTSNSGAGISILSGSLLLDRSTLHDNTATYGGALANDKGDMTLSQCTVSGNSASLLGGGVVGEGNTSTVTRVEHSIIAGNTGADVSLINGTFNSFTSGFHNVVGTGTGSSAFVGTGDQTGVTDPMLEPIGMYGGSTPNRPPKPGSPVINAGGGNLPGTDQRGFARPAGGAADVGAVEVQPALLVTTHADHGVGSLRRAVDGIGASGVITFDPGLSGQAISLTSGALLVNTDLTVDGSSLPKAITIDGGGASRVFEISTGRDATLQGMVLTGGHAIGSPSPNGYGGAILVGGAATLRLSNATLYGNNADLRGGALSFQANATGVVENCTFTGNAASISGSAIVLGQASLTMNHCTVSANDTSVLPGALNIIGGGILHMTNSIVAANVDGDFNNAGTLLGSNNFTGAQPKLAPLNDFGGPTPIMPLLPGSPAIEGGLATGLLADQRGVVRPGALLPDIGAVEAFAFSSLPLIDADNDDIDDRLEPAYGLVVGNDDRAADSDDDGMPDGQELFTMTDPQDFGDQFRIVAIYRAPGFDAATNAVYRLTLRTFPGLSYSFESGNEPGSMSAVPSSTLLATNHVESVTLPLGVNRAFLKARRD